MLVLRTGETGFGQNAFATFGGAIIVTVKSPSQSPLMQTSTFTTDPVATSSGTTPDSHLIVVGVISIGMQGVPAYSTVTICPSRPLGKSSPVIVRICPPRRLTLSGSIEITFNPVTSTGSPV